MTNRLAGAIAGAALASGIFIGWAGTTVARDATVAQTACGSVMSDHMAGDGPGSMMSMMSGSMMGPNTSSMPIDPNDHANHHMLQGSPEVSP